MNHDPTFAAAIVFGGWALALFAYGVLILSAMKNERRQRILFGLLVAVCLVIASPILYAAQPVTKYCATCASSVEPGSWAWYVFCWGC